MLVVAQDRAELAGSDKANVRRECCHAILHPAVWTREYKTRQPSRLFLPVARGCVLKSCCPGGRIQDYQRRDEEIISSNRVPLMIQRARQYKKIKDETSETIRTQPLRGQMRWKHGEMRSGRLCHRRDGEREREPLEDFGPWGMRDMGPVWRVC
ncbi:hypothetical protein CSPX01_17309 [Colletotrichum filicis]|nr:hypothetical protein CSPX01_17309 [Colletotrichum filicis]